MLVVLLIIGVIAMNISVLKNQRSKKENVVFVFKNPKIYLWFVPLAAIFFSVFLFNA